MVTWNSQSNSLRTFCILSKSVLNKVHKVNFLDIAPIRESKFWKRMLLDKYLRSDDMLEQISGSLAVMLAKKQKDIPKIKAKLAKKHYYESVCSFMVLKDDYLDVIEVEKEMWEFQKSQKPRKKPSQDFGWMSLVDSLANEDMTKYDYIENLDYSLVFVKVAMMADRSWSY